MRFRLFFCLAVLLPQLPLLAQDSAFPTLDALANVEMNAFHHAVAADRMTPMQLNQVPPETSQAAVGDREWLYLSFGKSGYFRHTEMELRAQTDRVLIWVQTGLDYPNWRAHALAQNVETMVLDRMQEIFQFAEPPGIDGDPRLIIALQYDPDDAQSGHFSRVHVLPKQVYARSNQREMIIVNLKRDDDIDFFDEILIEIIAHEYLHLLHHLGDFGEESWLDEGIASYAGFVASRRLLSFSIAHSVANDFLEAPNTGLTRWQATDNKLPKYGAGFLFITFLAERFGDEFTRLLFAEPADGWQSIAKVLRQHAGVSADEVFADWVLANYFLDARRGHGYRELDADLTPPTSAVSLNSFPATREGALSQYSTDYLTAGVAGADKLSLRLMQAPEAQLIETNPVEGDFFAYALASDYGNSRLTRAFELTAPTTAWLEFRIWHDLAENEEYGFVTISEDGGESWQTLRGRYTEWSEIYDTYYTFGYTGRSRGWLHERIDLSAYTPGKLLIAFEVVSNIATAYRGMAIDDVRIQVADYHEGFETPDDSWVAEGWIITDNRLPNNTWLQVVQDTGDQLHVSRELVTGNGELKVDLLPGVSNVLVAVSPVVPRTSLPTQYVLEAYLLNAADEVLHISRECTLTTTDALNFRDAPSGNKIGLLLKGTAVDALGRQGDWFQVDHKGAVGWVHGEYVTRAGNCP